MSLLFPSEVKTIDDFAHYTGRLRAAIGPHIINVLHLGISVVLDFPANSIRSRQWMRSLITQANVAHELHLLDTPDAICRQRLKQRNADGEHPYQVDDETYDLFMRYFVPPTPDEGFNIVVHTA